MKLCKWCKKEIKKGEINGNNQQYHKKCLELQCKVWKKEYNKRPEVIARRKEYNKRPEVKAKKKEYKRKWDEENKNKVKGDNKKWREEHTNYQKKYNKKYNQEHKEERKKYDKNYRQIPGVKERKKENLKRWRKENPDYMKEYNNKWHKENPDYNKKYRGKNKEKRNENLRRRRNIDKNFKIIENLRSSLYKTLKRYIKTGKIMPSKKYGIDYKAIIEYLSPLPNNLSDYHNHHIKPLFTFNFVYKDGSTNLEEIKKAFTPENHKLMLIEEHREIHKKLNQNKDE